MLSRLDDEMDRSAVYSRAAQLPPQLSGEPVPGVSSSSPTPSSSSSSPSSSSLLYLTSNSTVGARPLLSSSSPRTPLSVVVSSLVSSWSLAFLELARSSDPPSMLLIAQMMLSPRGYGALPHDRAEGVRWLMRCVELDEGEAREMAKRYCPAEYRAWLDQRVARGEGSALAAEEAAAQQRAQVDCAPADRRAAANSRVK